jgi:hypothetical protein
MDLDSSQVYDVLVKKDVKLLFHANTIGTSKTFLENGGLLSRQYAEAKQLFQTPQKSDSKDKELGIYNDVFLDGVNVSLSVLNYNFYGPVLFGFELELLRAGILGTVRVTKMNPVHWTKSMTPDACYFNSVEELEKLYRKRNVGHHIMLTTLNGFFPFQDKYLRGIQVDLPGGKVITSSGEKIPYEDSIIQYFGDDLDRLGIPRKKLMFRDEVWLKGKYTILHTFGRKRFLEFFQRKPEHRI